MDSLKLVAVDPLAQALTPGEAARYLGVSTMTLWRWVGKRRIRRIKIGRVVRYPISELDRFLEENTRERRGGRG